MKLRHIFVFHVLGLLACVEPAGGLADTSVEPVAAEPAAAAAALASAPMRPDVSEGELAAIRAREDERSTRALAEVERRFTARTPGLSFRVRRVRTNAMGDTHVWVQQVFRGTPVEGRDLGVIIFVDEVLQLIGEPDSFEGVAPARLTAAALLERARAHAAGRGLSVLGDSEVLLEPVYERHLRPGARGDNAADYETRVVGFERGARVRLARAPATELAPRELFVRERDGAVLERGLPRPAMRKATLRSAYAGTVTSLYTWQDADGFYNLRSERYDKVSAAGQTNGQWGFDYRKSTNDWGDGQLYAYGGASRTNGQTAAADAFISIYGVNRMFSDVYGQSGWDGAGGAIHATVHFQQDNAFALGNGEVLLGYMPPLLADGGVSNMPLADIETLGHEVGHMAYEAMTGAGHPPTGEMGGLDEGTADIFGLVAGFYLPDALALAANGCTVLTCSGRKPITVRGDWTYGNWITRGGPYSRSLMDPSPFPAWTPAITTAASHEASGPLRRMFYFLSVGVLPAGQAPSAGLLNPQRESPFLPAGMSGLGVNTANWIWYHTLASFYFSRITGYQSAREMMLEATTMLYERKPHTPQYKAVEDAWAAVNVGPPADRKPPTVVVTTSQKNSTEATVTVDVSDDNGVLSGTVAIESGIINGPARLESCTSRCVFTINPLEYGDSASHRVRVTAKDMRENEGTQTSYFALDAAQPNVTITSNHGTNWPLNHPQQDWKFSGTDASGIVSARVLLNGVPVLSQEWSNPPTPSFTFNSVAVDVSTEPEGIYPVRFETADFFGNTRVSTYSLAVDHTPPELCRMSAVVDPANNGNVTLSVTGRDNLSGLSHLSIDRAQVGQIASDHTDVPGGTQNRLTHIVNLPPGTYTFFSRCSDQRWNTFKTASQTVTVLGKCSTTVISGGAAIDERTFAMGMTSGTVTLSFHTYTVHDRIKVFSGTTLVADTGCVSTGDPSWPGSRVFSYSGATSHLKVRVEPSCNPVTAAPTTEWSYSLSCP